MKTERPLPPTDGPPVERPVMVQRWTDVVFLHWRFDPDDVQRLLPDGVEVDVHDGSAWVGLVPFRMERLGLPGVGPLPFVNTFPEINVRTYVVAGAGRGVWFFSLDIDEALPTLVARTVYHLPYCYGIADHVRAGDVVASRVDRRWPRSPAATTEIAVRTGDAVDPSAPLHRFLTGRWGLISSTRTGGLRYAAVDHPRWPLRTAEVVHLDDGLVGAAGLPTPQGPIHGLYSPGVDVRVGIPRRLKQGAQ